MANALDRKALVTGSVLELYRPDSNCTSYILLTAACLNHCCVDCLSVYLLLFTTSYYLRSPILWSVFLSLWSVIFKATNANPQLALYRVTNIWRNATLPAVRCKSFTFYKVVW